MKRSQYPERFEPTASTFHLPTFRTFAEEFHRQIHITRVHVNPLPKAQPGPQVAEESVEGTEKVSVVPQRWLGKVHVRLA